MNYNISITQLRVLPAMLLVILFMFAAPPSLVHAAAPVAGFGTALDFDGTDDYIKTNLVTTTAVDNVSLEAWVNWGGSTGVNQTIFYNGNGSANGYGLLINGANDELSVLFGGQTIVSFSYVLPVNEWHHIALVRDSGTWKGYVDANIQALNSTSTPSVPSGQTSLSEVSPYSFKGKIDEARIWDDVRTQAEIQANMYSHLDGSESGLVGYWPFEEGSGTTASDLTANGNNGTLTNMDAADWVISTPINFTTNENSPLTGTLSAYDADGDSLTYSIVNNDGGAAVITNASTGAFTYTPAASGTRTFTYKVNDGADSNIATVTVEVIPNNAPIAGFGTALDFDGTNDYVQAPYSAQLNPTQFTVEAWAKVAGLASYQAIVGNRHSSFKGFLLRITPTGVWHITTGTGSVWSGEFANGTAILNQWTHLAGTYDGTLVKMYLNGVLQNTRSTTFTPNPNRNFVIGRHNDASEYYFNGNIDEVRVWDDVRTEAEIYDNMNNTLAGTESNLVGYWLFDENTGTTAFDKTTNANNGTLTNMDAADWVTSTIPIAWTTNQTTAINDTLSAYDVDGDSLTYSIVSDDGGAAVLDNASTGAFTYTPVTAGTRTFTYKVNDGVDDSNIATVTVNVISLVVSNTGDTNDGDYSLGQNTLREAIANASAGDTITFDSSIAGLTITLTKEWSRNNFPFYKIGFTV